MVTHDLFVNVSDSGRR